MSDDQTIEQKLDAFVDGNIKPWFMARLREERLGGATAQHAADKPWMQQQLTAMQTEPTVPRVITADELEVGQVVAGFAYLPDEGRSNPWMISGQVTVVHRFEPSWPLPSGLVEKDGTDCTQITVKKAGFSDTTWDVDTFPHIVLLADAPTTSYAAEDHEDAEVTQWHERTKRVADILRDEARKVASATKVPQHVIVPPKRRDVTAADIRASEPGSCYEDEEGEVWEWDGEWFRLHLPKERLGPEHVLDRIFATWAPLTRSNATPRGDYTKRELPTEPGSVIQVTSLSEEYPDNGAREVLPFYASLHKIDGRYIWESLSRSFLAEPHRITGWNPVTLTVEES